MYFIKGIMALLQPNETYAVTTSVNAIVDAILCILKKVFNAGYDTISKVLTNISSTSSSH